MRNDRHRWRIETAILIAAAVALAIVSWALKPNPAMEAVTIFLLPLAWWMIERSASSDQSETAAQRSQLKRAALMAFALLTMLDTGPELVIHLGWLGEEWLVTVNRIWAVATGVFMVVAGNYLPKVRLLWRQDDDRPEEQREARFTGWLMVISGLTVVAAWLTLPENTARLALLGVMLAFIAVPFARRMRASATGPGSGPR